MAPKRKMQGKVVMVTVRAEENLASRATAIAALRRESISDVLRARLVEYVEDNRQLLGVLNDSIDDTSNTVDNDFDDPLDTGTPNAETIKACRELDEGKGISFKSKEELYSFLDS
jgi:antitoxin component of RelBE/YafQ-DinJ toxin-antitoxin module